MSVEVSIPISIVLFSFVVLLLYFRFEERTRDVLGGETFRLRDALLLALIISVTIIVWVFLPALVLPFVTILFSSFVVALTTYIFSQKRLLSALTAVFFVLLYLFFWNIFTLNVSAFYLAIGASIILNSLLDWKTGWIFVGSISVMDFIHVFYTKAMVEVAAKAERMALPLLMILPSPLLHGYVVIGVGDFLIASLIVVQTAKKFGRKKGFLCILFLFVASVVMGFVAYSYRSPLPATVFLISGWIAFLVFQKVYGVMKQVPRM